MDINTIKARADFARNILFRGIWNKNATILMYHRINTLIADPWQLSVSPENFYEQMNILKQYNVISMQEFVENIKKNKVSNSIAITFDDGYQDNFCHAKPILEGAGLPATFFVTTSAIRNTKEFWWDELDSVILKPGVLPDKLNISINEVQFSWQSKNDISISEAQWDKYKNWLAWNPTPTQRHALYSELSKLIRTLTENQRQEIFQILANWSGKERIGVKANLPMTENELKELSGKQLFDIGAHSVSHPALSSLSLKDQEREIIESKAYLEKTLRINILGFAYPYGSYNADTLKILKGSTYEYACTTQQKPVSDHPKIFSLPRFRIGNWDGKKFKQRIDRWLKFGV